MTERRIDHIAYVSNMFEIILDERYRETETESIGNVEVEPTIPCNCIQSDQCSVCSFACLLVRSLVHLMFCLFVYLLFACLFVCSFGSLLLLLLLLLVLLLPLLLLCCSVYQRILYRVHAYFVPCLYAKYHQLRAY